MGRTNKLNIMRTTLITLSMLFALSCFGQGLWQESTKKSSSNNMIEAASSKWRLNQEALQAKLEAPVVQLALPYPNGTLSNFTLKEASIMHPDLQKRFPQIKTFKGVNSKNEMVRMDLTPKGIHAIVFTKQGTIYIDPDSFEDTKYVSYYRSDYKKKHQKQFTESWNNRPSSPKHVKGGSGQLRPRKFSKRDNGTELKSYRIAIAADSEYSAFHGGTVGNALAAIVTTLNRVTGIYENELAITFQLVANNDEIIYPSSTNDPYLGLGVNEVLDENQTNLDAIIGDANYDIGHILTTGSGGLAGLGVVCRTGLKAQGTTGTSQPIGDPFDVDFVAHEIGHQFGANHTFNGSSGSCAGGNRNGSTAYEPGSGTTIMAYAGICGDDNIQNNSDAYFHAASLEEIVTFVSEGLGTPCADVSSTGNTVPSVEAMGGEVFIPSSTPFYLTAVGSDGDGDPLTYSWEQYDLGIAGSPINPSNTAPLFRSFSPTETSTRYFPQLSDVVQGTNTFGEILPTVSREMNFRVTARDNNPAGGGISSDDIRFEVVQVANPFSVTSQSEDVTLTGGSATLVTWEVANTNNAPISVDSVMIILSTDGGTSFTDTLLQATLNDGATFITLPNQQVRRARIMIAALDNLFFNVNKANFSIEPVEDPQFSLTVSEIPGISCDDDINLLIQAQGINGFAEEIALSYESDDPLLFSSSSNTISLGDSVTLTITNEAEMGEKVFSIIGTTANQTKEVNTSVSFLAGVGSPSATEPLDNATQVVLQPTIKWNKVQGASSYNFALSASSDFQDPLYESLNQVDTTFQIPNNLEPKRTYFWRVSSLNVCGEGTAASFSFQTANLVTQNYVATNVPVNILDQNTVTSTITIPDNLAVSDIRVVDLDISHTFVSDLTIGLSSPSGTAVTLYRQSCGSDANILVSFEDGLEEIECPPNAGGTFSPVEALSSFIGEPTQGDWILSVNDAFDQDQGIINGWGLSITSNNDVIAGVENVSSTTVDLSWNNISTNLGYEIEQSLDGVTFTASSDVDQDINAVTVENLMPSTEYFFRVRAVEQAGFSDYSDAVSATTLLAAPEAPSELVALPENSSNVALSWVDNSVTEESFSIERAIGIGSFLPLAEVSANVTNYVDEEIGTGLNYQYRVLASNEGGNSDYSNIAEIRILGIDLSEEAIFPNPASNHLTLSSELSFDHISIVDLLGRSVVELDRRELRNRKIDISNLQKGLYLVQVSYEDARRTIKLLKE